MIILQSIFEYIKRCSRKTSNTSGVTIVNGLSHIITSNRHVVKGLRNELGYRRWASETTMRSGPSTSDYTGNSVGEMNGGFIEIRCHSREGDSVFRLVLFPTKTVVRSYRNRAEFVGKTTFVLGTTTVHWCTSAGAIVLVENRYLDECSSGPQNVYTQ